MRFKDLILGNLEEGYNDLNEKQKKELGLVFRNTNDLENFKSKMNAFDQVIRILRKKNKTKEISIDEKFLAFSSEFLSGLLDDPNSDVEKEFERRFEIITKEKNKITKGDDLPFETIPGTNFEAFVLKRFGDTPKESDFNIFKGWCDTRGVSVCINERFVHFAKHYNGATVFRKKGDDSLFIFNREDRDGIVRLNKIPNSPVSTLEFKNMFNLSDAELSKILDGIGMSSAIRINIESRKKVNNDINKPRS